MPEPNHILVRDDLVFLLPCRSGNTSVKLMLHETLHGPVKPVRSRPDGNIHSLEMPFTYITLSDIDPAHHTVVGLIREPYARALSMWNYSYPDLTFEAFIKLVSMQPDEALNQHVRSQAYDLILDGRVLPHHWLRLEWLWSDWVALCRAFAWKQCEPWGYRNSLEDSGKDRRVPPPMTPEHPVMRLLFQRFAADFSLYWWAQEANR